MKANIMSMSINQGRPHVCQLQVQQPQLQDQNVRTHVRNAETEIQNVIRNLETELKNAVKGWIQGQNVSRAKDNELSSVINNNIFYSRDMSFHKNIEENITKLTVEKVNKAIKKYFKSFDKWTVVNAGEFKK